MKFIIGLIVGVIIFVVGPLFVQYTHWLPGSNGNGDWLQFWGSYLGVIPSGLIAWLVASKQIKSDRENSKIQHIESMYIDDLRQIQKILLLHHFSGQWQFPYNRQPMGSFTSPEIKMFREMFLNISGEGDKEVIKTDILFDIRTIVDGLPLSKRQMFHPIVDMMCDEILKLANYKPSKFQDMEKRYFATSSHKNDDDIHMKQFKFANDDWKENTNLFWSHIQIITNKFNELVSVVNDELSVYYKL